MYITMLGFNYCREPGPLSLLLKIVCGHKHGFTGVMTQAGCWENTRKACLEITSRRRLIYKLFECSLNIPIGLSRR